MHGVVSERFHFELFQNGPDLLTYVHIVLGIMFSKSNYKSIRNLQLK